MQETLRAANDGPLQQVTFQPVVDAGAGKLGVSVWHVARRPVYYGTSFVSSDSGWSVSSWGMVVAAWTGVQWGHEYGTTTLAGGQRQRRAARAL